MRAAIAWMILAVLPMADATKAERQALADLESAERQALGGDFQQAMQRIARVQRDAQRGQDAVSFACAAASAARIALDRSRFVRQDPEAVHRHIEDAVSLAQGGQGRPTARVCLAAALHERAREQYAERLARGTGDWAPIAAAVDAAFDKRDGNPRGLAHSRFYRGLVAQMQGRHEGARVEFQEALALARRAQDIEIIGSSLRHLAILDQTAGRLVEAEKGFEQSLQILLRGGLKLVVPYALQSLAAVAAEQGNPSRELSLLRDAVARAERTHSERAAAMIGLALSRALLQRADPKAARRAAEQALLAAQRYADPALITTLREHIERKLPP